MKIIYTSAMCSSKKYQQIFEQSKIKPGQQVQKYHQLITDGLIKNGVNLVALTNLPITNKITSKKVFKYEKDDMFIYLAFLNFPVVKHICIFLGSFFYCVIKLLKDKQIIVCTDILNISSSSGTILATKLFNSQSVGIVTDIPNFLSSKKSRKAKYNTWLMKQFSSYVFLTEEMNTLVNLTNKPYVVIEGQVDINMKTRENKLSEKFDQKICMYTGGLQKIYGIEYLVKGFLKANVENSELHIYGNGDFEDELVEICKKTDKVKYFGVVPNQEIVEKQLHATLLINPRPTAEEYTKYSFPSKNMEYMVSGTPTLTTKLPGMPKEYYPYVYLIKDETSDGIAKNFKEILNKNQEELHQKGLEAKEFVLEYKNNIVQTQKIINMLNSQ